MNDDDPPLDPARVAADDAALEALRSGSVPPEDLGLLLMHQLRADVLREPYDDVTLPVRGAGGSTVVQLSASPTARTIARSGVTATLVTAGLLSLGGVAAASTLAPPGTPLHALGQAVRSAAGGVLDAVSPQAAPTPTSPGSPGSRAGGPATVPSGPAVPPAVGPPGGAPVAAAPSPSASPTAPPRPGARPSRPARPARPSTAGPAPAPAATTAPRRLDPTRQPKSPRPSLDAPVPPTPEPAPTADERAPEAGPGAAPGPQPQPSRRGKGPKSEPGQSSSDASAKPRA